MKNDIENEKTYVEKQEEKLYVLELVKISRRIYGTANFLFYAIADGLFDVLSNGKAGIVGMFKKKSRSSQLTFFKNEGFSWA